VSPWAATGVAPAQLRAQIEAAFARAKPRRAVPREPDLFWEEPGLHGSGRQASLRSSRLASSKVGRGRLVLPARSSSALPPMPARGRSAGEVVLIASVAAAVAGGLAYYLWKRKPATTTTVGDDCGFDVLGAE
jgi:hypothetical protein